MTTGEFTEHLRLS